mgnify:CR=1 FL=1
MTKAIKTLRLRNRTLITIEKQVNQVKKPSSPRRVRYFKRNYFKNFRKATVGQKKTLRVVSLARLPLKPIPRQVSPVVSKPPSPKSKVISKSPSPV